MTRSATAKGHMMNIMTRTSRHTRAVALAAALLVPLGACDSILAVDLPGAVPAEKLDNPELAATLVNSVVADFECAYNNYTFGASAQSDEMWHSSGNLTFRNWGQRRITPDFSNYVTGSCAGTGFGLWVPLHTARFQAEETFATISSFTDDQVPERTAKLATVALYAGFSYTLLGETFCEMTIDGGDPMQPEAVLAIAESWFTEAIDLATAAGSEDVLAAAHLGRARVRLDLERWAEAAADARLVPEEFVLVATRSGEVQRRWNKGKRFFEDGGHATVAPGFRGLEFRGVPDPRVDVFYTGRVGFDGVTDLWVSTKYPDVASDIPLATGDEAQLIIAEVAARTNDPDTAVGIINDLHAEAGLPPFDPATDGDVLEHVIQERSRELFQEGGHRLNDMLRFGLPFFEGTDHIGQQYGSTTCFPLPLVES